MARYRRLRRPLLRRNRSSRLRRKPLRRRRFRFKRTPVLYVKLTRTVQVVSVINKGGLNSLNQVLNDFAEFQNLAPSFERVKVYRLNVRVFPHQNVSNNSTSKVPGYAIVPYHRPPPAATPSFSACLSIDRAKVYRGTAFGRMSLIPASRLDVEANTGEKYSPDRIDWKPEFEISSAAATQYLYTGFVIFETEPTAPDSETATYTIVYDLYVRFKNQRSFI
ncbi:capsid protein [Dragonfly associated cyclovirus 8]|uniref:Capsid protein n=1 Tax=Dragonfly associated cyclovirus 8 TaxID=1574362 RepID=M9V2X8_9CIRC|nr:capsid protein [Dragonfly associated cyclovirus 8]AGJ74759.1 capsid protein [Dragonfly associated cyclovirus 8]